MNCTSEVIEAVGRAIASVLAGVAGIVVAVTGAARVLLRLNKRRKRERAIRNERLDPKGSTAMLGKKQ